MMLISSIVASIISVPVRLLSLSSSSHLGPSSCLDSSTTLQQLVACLDPFTVPHDYHNRSSYDAAQPNADERLAWTDAIVSLLNTDNNCSSISLPRPIADIYSVRLFTDHTRSTYCVLFESIARHDIYVKGWGLMVVPATRAAVSRSLHLSAPHPASDLHTPQQAAALFKSVGAKSLFIPGRTRTAFLDATDCVRPTSDAEVYYRTDPAHDDLEPFYTTSTTIREWQSKNGGCPASSCAYIQLHGKGPSTCPNDQIFLSGGLGSSPSSKAWYTDDAPRPVKQLQAQLRHMFPTWNVTLPSDSPCRLTATKNIVGRLLNGVGAAHVCTDAPGAGHATGEFVHAEQAAAARGEGSYEAWAAALAGAFAKVSGAEAPDLEGGKDQ